MYGVTFVSFFHSIKHIVFESKTNYIVIKKQILAKNDFNYKNKVIDQTPCMANKCSLSFMYCSSHTFHHAPIYFASCSAVIVCGSKIFICEFEKFCFRVKKF